MVNFRTPKINKLNNLINWINTNSSYASLLSSPILKLPLDNSILFNNAWLSGFSEGDSSFQIRITKPNNERIGKGKFYYYVATTFELSQSRQNKELFNSYQNIMDSIANLFLAQVKIYNLSTYDRTGKQPAWRVRNSSKAGAAKIVEYFNQFPLFSSKHLDYLCWKEAFELIQSKKHHIKNGIEGLNRIEYFKKSNE